MFIQPIQTFSNNGAARTFRGTNNNPRPSLYEKDLNQLKDSIERSILPYKTDKMPDYTLLAKIGYDAQEKIKLVQEQENSLFQAKLRFKDNEAFKQSRNTLTPYHDYQKNIKDFERTVDLVADCSYLATPRVTKYINKSSAKMYENASEFNKFEKLDKKYKEITEQTEKDLDKFDIRENPVFFKRIRDLGNQNKTAVALYWISDFYQAVEIEKAYEKLKTDSANNKITPYEFDKRVSQLNSKIMDFGKDKASRTTHDLKVKEFLAENKDYKTKNITNEEINSTYLKLHGQVTKTIWKNSYDLAMFFDKNKISPNTKIMNETLNSQYKINKKLNELIQKEKEKYYSKLNQDIYFKD